MPESTFSPLAYLGLGGNLRNGHFSLQTGFGPVLQFLDFKNSTSYGFYLVPSYQFEKSQPHDVHRFGLALGFSQSISLLWNYEIGFVPKKNFSDNTFEPGFRGSINFGHGMNVGLYLDIPDVAKIGSKGGMLGVQFYFNFLDGRFLSF